MPTRRNRGSLRTLQDGFVRDRVDRINREYEEQRRTMDYQYNLTYPLNTAASPDGGWSQGAWNGLSRRNLSGTWELNPNAGYVTSQPETMVTVNIPVDGLPSDPVLSLSQQVVLAHARMTSAEIEADQIRQHIRHSSPADPRKDKEDLMKLRMEIAKQQKTIDHLRKQMSTLMLADEHIRREIADDPAYDSRNEMEA